MSKYFTIVPLEEQLGIGDQLYQMQTLYNMGRYFGWEYQHNAAAVPWRSRGKLISLSRFLDRFNYHEFLGLKLIPQIETAGNLKIIDSKDLFEHLKIHNGDPKKVAAEFEEYEALALVFNPWFYQDYAKIDRHHAIPLTHFLPLNYLYNEARKKDPVFIQSDPNKIRVVIHYRLMEQIWKNTSTGITQPLMFSEVFKKFVAPPEAYFNLLDVLTSCVGSEKLEIWFYSDGLPSLPWLTKMLMKKKHLNIAQALGEARELLSFQKMNLKKMTAQLEPNHIRIGDNRFLLREIIHSVATAPVVLSARHCGSFRCDFLWDSAFPDLGLRSPTSLPVISVNEDSPSVFREKLGHYLPTLFA